MMKEVIVIAHPEEDYARRFADYANEHNLFPLKAAAFSDKGKLKRFEKSNPVCVKIIPKEWSSGENESSGEKGRPKCLYFSEEETEEKMYVYRYQAADFMADKICEAAGIKKLQRKTITGEKTKLIGIYSPVGRCLKTSFSMTLGQMLSSRYKVLYLNFENYSGLGNVMGYSKPVDMADILYYFLNLNEEFGEKMEEVMVKVGGMDMVPPAMSFLDIESISEEEWDSFFDAITERGNYDYIILDLSDYVKGLYRILQKCSLIYTFAPSDGLAMAKVEQYEKLLDTLHYNDILERTRKVTPPVFKKLPIRPEELVHSDLAEYTKQITEDEFHWSKRV